MKKLKALHLPLLVPFFVLSCVNEAVTPEITPIAEIDIESLSETTQAFIPLANLAWEMNSNPDYKELLYGEVARKFDGEANALLKTFGSANTSGRSLSTEFVNQVNTTLQEFNVVSGEEFTLPQIYIPFYDELVASDKLGIKDPILVFRDGPPSSDGLYQGYSYQDNLLVDMGMISEEFAANNEVWVISLNERCDSSGKVVLNGNISGREEYYPHIYIKGVRIKGKSCIKEDWIAGAAEVSITVVFVYDGSYGSTNTYPTVVGPEIESGTGMHQLTSISRSEAKNNTYKDFGFSKYLVQNWYTSYPSHPYAAYAIFEYDPWPASVEYNYPNGIRVTFRSYETSFINHSMYRTTAETYSYSDGCFEYNLD